MKRKKYMASIDETVRGAFQRGLLSWYLENGRQLPWRESRDPYRVIVSEIMLQQTTVATVLPVFLTFMERFPSIRDVYEAPLAEIKAITDPLGYKVRGRWLKDIATHVVEERQGIWPDTLQEWMALPGVGRYTAGAVLSSAFNQDEPILDTNVKRVLGRYFGIDYRATKAENLHHLWALAGAVIPPGTAMHFNQALMDFGAMVCTARRPSCATCPLADGCASVAHDHGAAAAETPAPYEIYAQVEG